MALSSRWGERREQHSFSMTAWFRRLQPNSGTTISCNMDTEGSIQAYTSPTPPWSWQRDCRGRTGVVGARPTGLDWLTRLATSQPTSPWSPSLLLRGWSSPPLSFHRHPLRKFVTWTLTREPVQRWRHVHRPARAFSSLINKRPWTGREWSSRRFPQICFFFEGWIFFFTRFDVVVSEVYKWYRF